MNLYVSNLGDNITDESLRAIFATHGQVNSSTIVKDHITGASKGFAFIEMPIAVEAEKAIEKMNGTIVNGKNLSVKEARLRSMQKPNLIDPLK